MRKLNLVHIEAGHPFWVWGCCKAWLGPVVLEVLGYAMSVIPFYVHLTCESANDKYIQQEHRRHAACEAPTPACLAF